MRMVDLLIQHKITIGSLVGSNNFYQAGLYSFTEWLLLQVEVQLNKFKICIANNFEISGLVKSAAINSFGTVWLN